MGNSCYTNQYYLGTFAITGGLGSEDDALGAVLVYAGIAQGWVNVMDLSIPRAGHVAILVDAEKYC